MPSFRLVPLEPERAKARARILFWARLSFFLLGTVPWWLPVLESLVPLGPLAVSLHAPFMFVCHRMPERTIVILGEAMPICSRCAGIFSGLALGALLCWPRLTLKWARILLVIGGAFMLADVITQDLGVHPVWHATRLLTGGFLGWIASAALMTAIVNETTGPRATA